MRRIIAAILVTCGIIAIAAFLSACGGSHPITRAECKAQYLAWRTGPARTPGKSLVNHLDNLDFKAAASDARTMQSMPVPTCADPKGYYAAMLGKLVAMGNNSDAGLGYLLIQAKEVSAITDKMSKELVKTTGVQI